MKEAKLPINNVYRKRWFKITFWLVMVFVVLPLLFYGVLRLKSVQTYIAGKITSYLSNQLHADISIGGVDISFLYLDLIFEKVYVSDQHRDTLVYAGDIRLNVNSFSFKRHTLLANNIALENGLLNLKIYKGDSIPNLKFLIDYFASKDTSSVAGPKWTLKINGFGLKNMALRYRNFNDTVADKGIDFSNLDIRNLNLSLKKIEIGGDSLSGNIKLLSFRERSGFSLEDFSTVFVLSPKQIDCKNLLIKTGNSNLDMDLNMGFNSLADFGDILNKVNFTSTIRKSEINTKDITYFAPDIWGFNNKIELAGIVKGPVNKIRLSDFSFKYGTQTYFEGKIKLDGLPDIEETFVQLNARELRTNQEDLNSFKLPGGGSIPVPDQVALLGGISFTGNFTGYYNDFVSRATFRTDLGVVSTDLSLKYNRETHNTVYSGVIGAKNFDLGKMTGASSYVKKINMNATINGSGLSLDKLDVTVDGKVDSIEFMNNRFEQFKVNGHFKEKKFDGSFAIRDPLLQMDFDGSIDLNKSKPVFDFTTNIRNAHLNQLNLVKSDSSLLLSTKVKLKFQGIQVDSITGSVTLDSTTFVMNQSRYKMDHFLLLIIPGNTNKEIILNSDFVDANVSGSFTFGGLYKGFNSLLRKYMPSLASKNDTIGPGQPGQKVDFKIDLKNTAAFSRMFLPAVRIADKTTFNGSYSSIGNAFEIRGASPLIAFNKQEMRKWTLYGKSGGNTLSLIMGSDQLIITPAIGLDSMRLSTSLRNDSINFLLAWKNKTLMKNNGDIEGVFAMNASPLLRLHLFRSTANINDSLWVIPGDNMVEFDNNAIRINNFILSSGNESIKVNGVISNDPLNSLNVDLNNFDLANFDPFLKGGDFDIKGFIDGKIEVSNVTKSPNLMSNLTVRNLSLNGDKLGNASILSRWDPLSNSLYAKAEVIFRGNIGENKPISLEGHFYPDKADSSLDFSISLVNFRLKTISNLLSSFSSKFTGFASGDLRLTGSLSKPEINGNLRVARGVLRVDYLNIDYSFNHEIHFGKNIISFDNLVAYDSLANKAICSGRIMHDYFRNFSLDITIQPQKLLSMNTTGTLNSLFYGKAFSTGMVKIYGPVEDLNIDITAKTDKGTSVFLPISTTAAVSDNNYITFVKTGPSKDSINRLKTYNVDLSGVTMNLDMEATPDASIKIYMPFNMGNIKATGAGNLKMGINTRGEFSIYGDYLFQQGSFQFNLQNVLSRYFEIQPGGKIAFTGDPYSTKVKLRAIYKIDVPLTGLRLTQDQSASMGTRKVPVNCIIDLKGNLFNPDIVFKLELTEKDPELSQIIFSQIDTTNVEQMSEQMIFLMVLKRFKPFEKTSPIDIGSSVGGSSFDLISSQLNSWLSQISNNFDIGVNYKPGDKLTSDEITVALSTQLFDERVSIESNLGVAGTSKTPSTTNQNASNIVGDVNISVKLSNDGRFRVKAFNKSNNTSILEANSPYTQGVGVFYRKEFDNIGEFFKKKKKSEDIKK